ncbi:trafficking protein particle complex subunit 1 [Blastocystis sp. ATCC 50177/Nand II]|uniref:Trafficking protein particle complex subunit n=1 Tax=Blastocystis sp. subtype 1 (strain ATCC 50177 / NandII) TaxID=478820 RepID=A0A196SBQ6_BLAHN|nr:trafficking protein particle complex subunit 1 [Blastocystis sp. ATCC 50177/Nand II]
MSEKPLRDVTADELKYARIYYIAGFFCLPMVWMLVVMNWWRFRKSNTENGKKMRTYVMRSLVGCVIWAVALVIWCVVYQFTWEKVPFFRAIQMMSPEGIGIFYREYHRTCNAFEGNPEEESKLICGFLLSMNALIEKFSINKEEEHGMHSFQTKSYMFHYLEVPSGVRIVINTDLSAHDIQTQLWAVYDAFVKLVVSNPNWGVEDEIDMPDFTKEVDRILC